MKRRLTCFLRGATIFLLTAGAAWAQGTAQLSGTVRDEGGGVLPGVTITVTQTNTGLTRTTVTDGDGSYLLTNLPIGPYQLEVALQGFRTYVQTGIVLQVGGTPTVNAVLGVGSLEESVTVVRTRPVLVCVTVTVTPGSTPPLSSRTVPPSCAVACAQAAPAVSRRINAPREQ